MKNMHFIGIGGTGMSGLANICLKKGYTVSGSDLKLSETTNYLRNKGANIIIGHKNSNIFKNIDVVIYSTAIKKNNPEIKVAKKLNIDIWHRSELLNFLSKKKKIYSVVGAHGKTTTTVMLAEIFNNAKAFPTVSAGGKMLFCGANGIYSKKSKIIINELDESDGSFLRIKSNSAIITNIDNDHLNYYHTKKEIIKAFNEFITKVKKTLVINGEDNILKKIMIDINKKNIITFGFKNCDYIIKEIDVKNYKNSGKVFYKNKYIGKIIISLPGKHNLLNALGAIAFAREKKISDDIIFKTLKTFKGVGRRFETIGEKRGITIIDDYAHHPNEIKALLTGVKSFGYKRIISIFQPHRFTRTKQLFNDFKKVLSISDIIIISPIYSAGEKKIKGITSKSLAEAIGKKAFFIANFKDITKYLLNILKPEDLVLTIGAGDICDFGKMLLKKL